MSKPCCQHNVEPTKNVIESYELCTQYDDFVENRCVWVVDLKDGTKVFQDDDRPGVHTPSAWKRLGYYVNDYPDNSIDKMRLRFGTHIIELPLHQKLYFYSRGLLQAIQHTCGLDFHIVGCPINDKEIECVWWKIPELTCAQSKVRNIEDCNPEQIIWT